MFELISWTNPIIILGINTAKKINWSVFSAQIKTIVIIKYKILKTVKIFVKTISKYVLPFSLSLPLVKFWEIRV